MPLLLINVAAAMLFIAVLPLPYGYYMLLRLVATVVFAWGAYLSYNRGKQNQAVLLGLLVLLYNPIILITFSKIIWTIINICSAIYLLGIRAEIQDKA
ncbi:MAG TPA: DUF6804 family protein [Alcanivoracaceae bacterium]|nr:DUF6804 family protein [Alcanivoracaceae bacterium]